MAKAKIIYRTKKGFCHFCKDQIEPDWKNLEILGRFINERGKILPSLNTGTCAKHQRRLSQAIKRARYLGLLPFISRV